MSVQAAFLTYAMGGSKSYDGNANMTAAHDRLARDLGMRMEHFDIVLEHLGGALRDLQVPEVGLITRSYTNRNSNECPLTCRQPFATGTELSRQRLDY